MNKTRESSYNTGIIMRRWEWPLHDSSCAVNRQQRMAEILAIQQKAKFGSVKEISAVDYVDEVNKAGEGVWVLLHLYKTGQVLQ